MLVWVIPEGIQVRRVPPGQPGPAFFPKVLCSAILILGMLILAKNLLARVGKDHAERPAARPSLSDNHGLRGRENRRQWAAPLLMVIIILLYIPLLLISNFIASSALAVVFSALVFGERRWWLMAVLAVTTPVLLWVFATRLLQISMP